MLNSLPFWHDPKQFLQSYFWGCNQGHELSLLCKQQLEHVEAGVPQSQDSTPNPQLSEKVMESLLDCYVHTKVCSRCEPMEKVTCHRGYELIEERDSAFDDAIRLGVQDRRIDKVPDACMSQEQIQAVFNKAFAQQQFLQHMSNCEICTSKRPMGRYSIAAWNIDVARSQRLD